MTKIPIDSALHGLMPMSLFFTNKSLQQATNRKKWDSILHNTSSKTWFDNKRKEFDALPDIGWRYAGTLVFLKTRCGPKTTPRFTLTQSP